MKYRAIAMDTYSSEAGEERERPAPGAKPVIVTAANEEDALELAIDIFGTHPRDFIKITPL